MKLINSVRRFFRGRREPTSFEGKYDAAQTTRENQRHWSMADAFSADSSMTPEVRRILRNRSRYETANNSYCKGIVLTLATDTIGTGPRLQLSQRDDKLIRKIEDDFESWTQAVNLPEKLRTMRMAKATDGEVFAILTSNQKINHSVKLDITPIEAERIASPHTAFQSLDDTVVDGIEFDKFGNVTNYHLLKTHPGDLKSMRDETLRIPASAMIHWFRSDRPEQHRGVPELVPALPLFAQLRRYTLAVIEAAETAARFPMVIYTTLAPEEEGTAGNPFDLVSLDRTQATVLPEGYQLGQMKAEQPTTRYPEFKREILGEIGRALQIPINIVTCDSSKHNYASGRLDHQVYHRAVRIEQAHCGNVVMEKIFEQWLAEYKAANDLPYYDTTDLRAQWFWDGFEHVDPIKEAMAQKRRIENRTTTLAAEYARQGKDWEDEVEQLAEERRKLLKLGLLQEPVTIKNPTKKEGESEEA
ncbi:MAG: phage portal protein [Thermoguttaceae bacterium]